PSCTASLQPTSISMPAGGGSGTFAVTATAGCQWSAISSDPWILIGSGASGTGNGMVALSVTANTGATRTGRIQVAGATFTVNQSGAGVAPCAFGISPTTVTAAAAGGPKTVAVSTTNGCAWTATSNSSWLTITSGSSGSGSGTVAFTVAA